MTTPSNEIYLRAERVRKLVQEINKELDDLSLDVTFAAEDWEDRLAVGDAFFALWALRQRLKDIYENYESIVWDYFQEPLTLASGATLEAREGKPRIQWNHAKLARAVADRLVAESFDFETGEMLRSFEDMVVELLQYAGVGYWKVKGLKKLGINPDDYSTAKDPLRSIKVSTTKEEGDEIDDNDE